MRDDLPLPPATPILAKANAASKDHYPIVAPVIRSISEGLAIRLGKQPPRQSILQGHRRNLRIDGATHTDAYPPTARYIDTIRPSKLGSLLRDLRPA